MKLMLGNIDYRQHMTDEGNQFQLGLESAGWTLAGFGYADGCADVPQLLDMYAPDSVVVHDKRDWDPGSGICFNRRVAFTGINALRNWPGAKFIVIKDAATWLQYQFRFCDEVAPTALIVYYHPESVLKCAPWLRDYTLIRTYHTVDRQLADTIGLSGPRQRGIVTGALSRVAYPLRHIARKHARMLGIRKQPHPGHSNRGCHTPAYLRLLAGYKVHVACASAFGFALRKIIESVAMGCTPITDLPADDVLPEIDGALVRVPTDAKPMDLKKAIDEAEASWNLPERLHYAAVAQEWYDWRTMGQRLSVQLEQVPIINGRRLRAAGGSC